MNFGPYKLEVISNNVIAPNILQLSAKGEQPFNFIAGQYYSIRVAEKVNRAYSIASTPGSDVLEFVVDITPQGLGSKFVQALKPGDRFDVLGPFGHFNLEKLGILANESPLYLLATGTGIAPFRSMVLDLLVNRGAKREIRLYFGLRHDEEEYFFEEFKALATRFSNFKFIPVVSRPSSEWKGAVGHCQQQLLNSPVEKDAKLLICGRTETVKAISSDLLAHGYGEDQVFFEKYG